MRLFLAIDLPDKTKKLLDEQIQLLKKEYPAINWIPTENYHITIHHFGEVTDVEKLKKKIEKAIYDIEAFHMYALSADLFMSKKIVLYALFNRQKNLEQLVHAIEEQLQIESKNQYVPHLTFGRTKIPSKQQYLLLQKKLERLDIDFDFPVKKVGLFESIDSANNPLYKKVCEFKLQERL